AGAETSVRGYFRLSLSKALRRGRAIRMPDATGIKSLVASSWFWRDVAVFMVALPSSFLLTFVCCTVLGKGNKHGIEIGRGSIFALLFAESREQSLHGKSFVHKAAN